MKLAIILTGNLRTYELVGQIITKALADYEVDYFCSIDLCNRYQNANKNLKEDSDIDELAKVEEIYHPKRVYSSYDCSFDFESELKGEREVIFYQPMMSNLSYNYNYNYNYCLEHGCEPYIKSETFNTVKMSTERYRILFRQYFFVSKGYEIFYQYQKETNKQYDLVMRLRFDQYLFTSKTHFQLHNYLTFTKENIDKLKNIKLVETIKLPKVDTNEVIIFSTLLHNGYIIANDQFWVTNFETSKIMAAFYRSLPIIIKESEKEFHPMYGALIEHLFAKYLLRHKLKVIDFPCHQIGGIFIRAFE